MAHCFTDEMTVTDYIFDQECSQVEDEGEKVPVQQCSVHIR